MANKTYTLLPEHAAQLQPWAKKWIDNAMSTVPMTEEDKTACVTAAHGIYQAAGLEPPKSVVFVRSPFEAVFVAGFASAIIEQQEKGGELPASVTPPVDADHAVYKAVWDAVRLGELVPTRKVAA